METLKKYLEETNKKSFLDIGTGPGNFIHFLKSLYDDFEKVVGIDISERAIVAAKKNNKDERITFEKLDAYEMYYDDKSFDVICLSNSLHHLKDISKLLLEMKRVLKDDGFIFAVCIPRTASYCDMFSRNQYDEQLFLDNVKSVIKYGNHNDRRRLKFTNAYFHEPQEFINEIKEVGLNPTELINIEGVLFLLPPYLQCFD